MTPDRAYEDYYAQLQSVVSKVLAHIRDFSALFSLVRLKSCSHLTSAFASNVMNGGHLQQVTVLSHFTFAFRVRDDRDRRKIQMQTLHVNGSLSRI